MTRGIDTDLMTLSAPVRETLQGRVYQELKAALMRGHFVPGRSLTIRALAAAMGTSPMPVREALRQLTTERAVDTLANRSFGTPILSRAQFHDLKRIRIELEGFAAAEAAKRIDEAEIDQLVEIERQMSGAEKRGERSLYIAHNQEFHFKLYRAAGSDVLIPIIESLWLQIGPYIPYVFMDGVQSQMPHSYHDGMIEALRARDPVKARKMLEADITTAATIIEVNANFAS